MQRRGRKAAKELIVGVRTFLRWLQFRGKTETDLLAAVPAVADWRLRSLPPALTPQQVRRVLQSCNRHTPVGLRDRAILLLVARLGIRAGEVVRLRLEDIDWREGELLLQRKPGREERMPLPPDVGRALLAYLKDGRPNCDDRNVFLCVTAPHRGFGSSSPVSSVVAAALRRAGLKPEHRGTHLLRHTLARELLWKGAALSEIANLLGHRQISATEIYARVDFKALRSVAQPWPGGGSR
ncbi:MAG: site-specific integrase [Planctomycetota bacterium]